MKYILVLFSFFITSSVFAQKEKEYIQVKSKKVISHRQNETNETATQTHEKKEVSTSNSYPVVISKKAGRPQRIHKPGEIKTEEEKKEEKTESIKSKIEVLKSESPDPNTEEIQHKEKEIQKVESSK